MFILASKSPRRIELMKQITNSFLVVPADINEKQYESLPIQEAVREIAYHKAEKIAPLYPYDVVIAADTIVTIDNMLIGKPKDEDDAIRILKLLSDREHKVITSVCIFYQGQYKQIEVISSVKFFHLDDKLINEYVATKSPLDKAGAYGVQDNKKFPIIKEVTGSLDNVIGFPVKEIKDLLNQLKVEF